MGRAAALWLPMRRGQLVVPVAEYAVMVAVARRVPVAHGRTLEPRGNRFVVVVYVA